MIKYEQNEDKEKARLELWRQLRAVWRKYGRTQRLRALNQRIGKLYIVLGYPKGELVYYPSGVYEITMKSKSPRYDYFAIYVRDGEYEVRLHDGFMKDNDPYEVRRYLERKNGEV